MPREAGGDSPRPACRARRRRRSCAPRARACGRAPPSPRAGAPHHRSQLGRRDRRGHEPGRGRGRRRHPARPRRSGRGGGLGGQSRGRVAEPHRSATRKVVKNIPLPATPDGIAVGAGAVWVVNGRLGTLYRVDLGFNRVTHAIRLGDRALTFTAGGVDVTAGAVWAAFGDSTIARAETGAPASDRHWLDRPRAGRPGVCVRLGLGLQLRRCDRSALRPGHVRGGTGRRDLGREVSTGIAAGAGAVWIASTGDDFVTRLDVDGLGFSRPIPIPVGDGRPPWRSATARCGFRTRAPERSHASTARRTRSRRPFQSVLPRPGSRWRTIPSGWRCRSRRLCLTPSGRRPRDREPAAARCTRRGSRRASPR